MFYPTKYQIANNPVVAAIAVGLAICAISLTAWRTYNSYSTPTRDFDWTTRGMSDFHNGVYNPARAFRDGASPYSPANVEQYDLTRAAPTYSPVVFFLHWPLTFLDLPEADIAFFVVTLGLLAWMAWLGPKMSKRYFSPAEGELISRRDSVGNSLASRILPFCGLLTLIVISRPGHMTLFTGYFTAELVIGTIIAIHYANARPLVSGLGMMVASGKPTFALPLIFMMVCRRNFRAVAFGILFCVIAGLGGIYWLTQNADGGLTEVIDGVRQGQEALHGDVTEFPVNLWTRTDFVGVGAKFLNAIPGDNVYLGSMFLILLLPGYVVWRIASLESNSGGAGLTCLIITLSILLCIYHQAYECLLLVIPWIGLTFYGQPAELGTRSRIALSLLLAVPAVNYASTITIRDYLKLDQMDLNWQLITAVNTVCMLLALLIAMAAAMRYVKKVEALETANE